MSLTTKLKEVAANSPVSFEGIFSRLVGWFKWADVYAPIYLSEEVELDIKVLRSHRNVPLSEKRQDPLIRKITRKYQEAYCPNPLYKHFPKKDKFRYFCLRLQIDELLQ